MCKLGGSGWAGNEEHSPRWRYFSHTAHLGTSEASAMTHHDGILTSRRTVWGRHALTLWSPSPNLQTQSNHLWGRESLLRNSTKLLAESFSAVKKSTQRQWGAVNVVGQDKEMWCLSGVLGQREGSGWAQGKETWMRHEVQTTRPYQLLS